LLDKNTYDILTKVGAFQEVERLKDEIKSWLKDHEATIDADLWLYIE